MTVLNAIKIHGRLISVSGPCMNALKFTSKLVDEFGNKYDAHIPFDRAVTFDDSKIMLGIVGEYDVKSLIGRMLKSVA